MASLRNLVITIVRLAGATSVAAALALPRTPAQPPTADDHELLIDFAGALICRMAGNSAGSGTRNRSPAIRREPCIARPIHDQPAAGRSFLGAVARHRRSPPTAHQRPAPMAAETPVSEPFSSGDLVGLKDVDGFGELPGPPRAAAELAQDAPGLELRVGTLARAS